MFSVFFGLYIPVVDLASLQKEITQCLGKSSWNNFFLVLHQYCLVTHSLHSTTINTTLRQYYFSTNKYKLLFHTVVLNQHWKVCIKGPWFDYSLLVLSVEYQNYQFQHSSWSRCRKIRSRLLNYSTWVYKLFMISSLLWKTLKQTL